MSKHEATPGWYWATTTTGAGCAIEYCVAHRTDVKPLWLTRHISPSTEFPPGWTLGPKIDNLLRDAARYRLLRRKPLFLANRDEQISRSANPGATADALIDAEIAREKQS